MVPANQYTGTVFHLSQDYPKDRPVRKLPEFFTKLPKKFTTDFKAWRPYMMAIRDYCFEGNLDIDWRVEQNKVRKWYHIPWQHYGSSGREGIHGLTKEAPVQPGQLAQGQGRPTTNDFYQTYAVGFFNEFGAYTIGRVWNDHMQPDPSASSRPNGFPEGTVISKLLFVDVPIEQVPSLVNPVQWQGYIQQAYLNTNRSIRTLSLIQMDIAVKDERAPTGWLFGTFQYNGALQNQNRWNNLIPVGIMWGNDPGDTNSTYTNPNPIVTKINPDLKETVINPDTNELPPTHLGWNGRLNGPVDNPRSSCMSCHMTAEVPTLSPLNPLFGPAPVPAEGSPQWMRWFQNLDCAEPFDPGTKSTDYSLQLAIGITNFDEWNTQGGLYAGQYTNQPAYAPRALAVPSGLKAAKPAPKVSGSNRRVFPIIRDLP